MAQIKIKTSSEFTFPELKEAEKYLKSTSPNQRIIKTGRESIEAFGEKNLQNPQFRKQLRRLQEKYRLKGLA